MAVIDAGHYPTEQPIVASLANYLKQCFPTLVVSANCYQSNVFKIY